MRRYKSFYKNGQGRFNGDFNIFLIVQSIGDGKFLISQIVKLSATKLFF